MFSLTIQLDIRDKKNCEINKTTMYLEFALRPNFGAVMLDRHTVFSNGGPLALSAPIIVMVSPETIWKPIKHGSNKTPKFVYKIYTHFHTQKKIANIDYQLVQRRRH